MLFFCGHFLSYHLFPAVYIKYMRLRGRGKLPEKSFKSFELYRQFHYLRYSKLNELLLQNDSIKLRIFFFRSYPRAEKMNVLWNTMAHCP